jgi:hypothetical protein
LSWPGTVAERLAVLNELRQTGPLSSLSIEAAFSLCRPATCWPTWSQAVGGERRLFKKANAKQV